VTTTTSTFAAAVVASGAAVAVDKKVDDAAPAKSGYAVTSYSGEIIQENIYVSDGSEDSDFDDETEVVLVGSRTGIMQRGLQHLSTLQQPN
jgi:hypothetical protein